MNFSQPLGVGKFYTGIRKSSKGSLIHGLNYCPNSKWHNLCGRTPSDEFEAT